jgi:hypothetical protein
MRGEFFDTTEVNFFTSSLQDLKMKVALNKG